MVCFFIVCRGRQDAGSDAQVILVAGKNKPNQLNQLTQTVNTMTDSNQYKIENEPYYEVQGKEVALYEDAYASRWPVMIKGPTGCGKSRFVEHMAW